MTRLTIAFVVSATLVASAPVSAQSDLRGADGAVTDARRLTPKGPNSVSEKKGTLTCDAERRELRFETRDARAFTVPFDRLVALHTEESRVPPRFLWRSNFYLTVHYTGPDGEAAVETLRFGSHQDQLDATAVLRNATGRSIDHSPAFRSLQGIPIRARAGTRLTGKTMSGDRFTGTVAALSATTVTVETGATRLVLDESSLQQLRLPYTAGHDAKMGMALGATIGALGGLAGAAFNTSGSASANAGWVVLATGLGAGVGAAVNVTLGALHYPFNRAFDVYTAPSWGARRRPDLAPRPQLDHTRRALQVSIAY